MKSPLKISAIALAGFLAATTPALANVGPGQAFPRLTEYGLIGQLPDQYDRVVLVDFWATWCAPCRSTFPVYDSLQREFGDRGLTIIAVSVDKDVNPYTRFLDQNTPSFSVVRDADQKLVAAVHPPVMPTCYLIDRHGVVRAMFRGFHGNPTVRELREEITKLLEEKP